MMLEVLPALGICSCKPSELTFERFPRCNQSHRVTSEIGTPLIAEQQLLLFSRFLATKAFGFTNCINIGEITGTLSGASNVSLEVLYCTVL